MGRIVISENVSLDGVTQDPAGVEGFRLGGWIGRIGSQGREEAAKVALAEAQGAEASRNWALGRRPFRPPSGVYTRMEARESGEKVTRQW